MARKRNLKQPSSKTEAPKVLPKSDLPPLSSILYQENPKPKLSLHKENTLEKLWRFSESNFFWGGGVAMALASYAFLLTQALKFSIVLLVVAWVVITISIFKHNFFERGIRKIQIIGNSFISLFIGIVLCVTWLWLQPQPNPSQVVSIQPTPLQVVNQFSDEKLAAIEFNSEATKELRSLLFKIELKRPYLLNEIGHFRTYFEFVDGEKFEISVGCQSKFDKNNDYLIFNRIWSNSKNTKRTSKSYSMYIQGGNTLDLLHCSVASLEEKLPYQTINDLEKRQVKIYATDSLVEKIKSISLVANNYKILFYDADKFIVNSQEPDVKWFIPLSDSEKAVQWQFIGLKDPSEKVTKMLEADRKREDVNLVWGWHIDFAESPPTKLLKYFE